jgi:hypothetical protein
VRGQLPPLLPQIGLQEPPYSTKKEARRQKRQFTCQGCDSIHIVLPGLIAGLQDLAAKGQAVVYKRVHMVLGEGNFVLVVAEATFGGVPTAIYDLFRIENGKIAEHWDTLEAIPPRTSHPKRPFR